MGIGRSIQSVCSITKGVWLGGTVRWDRGVVSWEVQLGGIGVWSVGRYG